MSARILVVEDDAALRDAICDTADLAGYDVAVASNGRDALTEFEREAFDLVISDVQMEPLDGNELLQEIRKVDQSIPVILMTAYGSIANAVGAMRDGATDYLAKPFEAEVLVSQLAEWIKPQQDLVEGIAVFEDPVSTQMLELIHKVAQSDAAVMITGESGVGKEVVFRLIHEQSNRSGTVPVAINCAAIPDNMLEAMLFGYEKGAFTGAYKSCTGKFEQAQHSTLLLDEISEMSLPLQAKLLRVLQEQQVERLGSHQTIDLDVRVVATSNRNLKEQVANGSFREDLYYRLNVFPIAVPALRVRPRDILPLARHFAADTAKRNGTATLQIDVEAAERLLAYSWPGNVRELDNVIQRACILQSGGVITGSDLIFETETSPPLTAVEADAVSAEDNDLAGDALGDGLKDHERRLILDALDQCNGSRKYAAEKLEISPRTLRYKIAEMREAGIAVPGR